MKTVKKTNEIKTCSSCGNNIPTYVEFCPYCGEKNQYTNEPDKEQSNTLNSTEMSLEAIKTALSTANSVDELYRLKF